MPDGLGITATAIGGALIYAGIKGYSILQLISAIVTGKEPVSLSTIPLTTGSEGQGTDTAAPSYNVPAPGSPTSNKGLAQQMAASRGWTGAQWDALDKLWTRESGFNNKARNPSSGAYGIPQALPPTKMPKAAQAPQSDAKAQIQWGLDYIAGRYGNPVNAWAHETSAGWY